VSASPRVRYTAWNLGIGLGAALIVIPFAATRGPVAIGWGLLGWSVMVLVGAFGGAWVVARHGAPGAGFLVAMGTCMLARLFGAAAGALVAGMQGTGAVWPYLAGLGVGYIPLQFFEIGWFMRHTKYDTAVRSSDAHGN
jgi:hypothetical protein